MSYVINGTKSVTPEKRQRVLDIIEKTGYQPNIVAKTLRTKKSNSVGVLAEDILGFSTARIINGISEYMENTDYHILLNDLRMLDSLYDKYDQIIHQKDKINKALSFLIHGAKVDAVIYVGMFDRDVSGIIPNINKPVIVAYSTSKDAHTGFVTYDNEVVSEEMIDYLLGAGHSRIAVITGTMNTPPVQLRFKGIYKALDRAGLKLDESLVKIGDWGRDSGYNCTKELLSGNALPTAIFAMNDFMAIGAMDAIREAGLRVPQDISVTGFDNRSVADIVYPRLTTAEIDLKAIGFTAAEMVASRLANIGQDTHERRIIIPSNIILRDSV